MDADTMGAKSTDAGRTEGYQMHLRRVHCRYDGEHITDIDAAVAREFARDGEIARLRKRLEGKRIAVGVGSRGIANLEAIVTALGRRLRAAGADPFVIPAMGSHGGATAEGQREVLESYGVTEARVGMPVRSSMETVEIPAPDLGHRVFMDRNAWESDGVILVGRIKVHTDYHGAFESGLIKMTVIGLGKQDQATAIHSYGVRGLREKILPTSRKIIATGKVLGGIGIVENAYDQTRVIRLVPADRFEAEEPALLELARANMPKIPVRDIDVLVVDRLGKDVSGSGMDTNIIGRIRVYGQSEPDYPNITSILVADLTPASHGNAVGVGIADVITRRLYDKIDFDAMNANVVTSSFFERGKIPVVAETDRQAFEYAVRGAALGPDRPPRTVRMLDTLHAHDLLVSEDILAEIASDPSITVDPGTVPLFRGDTFTPYPDASS